MQLRTRQGGPIPTRQQRPARWADFHTAAAPARWAYSHTAAAPGKEGRFPHSTGARQGGPIPTRQQRPARWADFHTAPAPGKVGRFPRQRRRQDGRISTQHRRPARWADSHTTAAPGKMGGFPYRHVCSLCYPWIVQLSGSLVVWRSVPVTGRVRPLAQYGAATRRRAAVPARRRAAPTAHPVGDVRQLCGGERD
jgi:hypothetical protein